jgi:hypothetical protein
MRALERLACAMTGIVAGAWNERLRARLQDTLRLRDIL